MLSQFEIRYVEPIWSRVCWYNLRSYWWANLRSVLLIQTEIRCAEPVLLSQCTRSYMVSPVPRLLGSNPRTQWDIPTPFQVMDVASKLKVWIENKVECPSELVIGLHRRRRSMFISNNDLLTRQGVAIKSKTFGTVTLFSRKRRK